MLCINTYASLGDMTDYVFLSSSNPQIPRNTCVVLTNNIRSVIKTVSYVHEFASTFVWCFTGNAWKPSLKLLCDSLLVHLEKNEFYPTFRVRVCFFFRFCVKVSLNQFTSAVF